MATIIKATPGVRTLDQGKYSSHTGNVYIMKIYGEDGGLGIEHIWAASPTAANFNAAPVGSWLHDTDSYGTVKIHTAATTWVTITVS